MLQEIAAKPWESPVEIPPGFIEVGKAGTGAYGSVYFCLPEHEVALATNARQLSVELVAVKTVFDFGKSGLANELETLQYIQRQASRHQLKELFAEVIDWDTSAKLPGWIVTTTWPVCCDLVSLTEKTSVLPEEYLWLVYTQLHKALDFLHRTCNPPVAHADLHKGNIIIGFANPNSASLPQLKLIDFGLSEQYLLGEGVDGAKTNYYHQRDTYSFFATLDHVVHENVSSCQGWTYAHCASKVQNRLPKDRSEEFYSFHAALNDGRQLAHNVAPKHRQVLWEKYGGYATRSLAVITESSTLKIRDAILEVTASKVEARQKKIEELLDRYIR